MSETTDAVEAMLPAAEPAAESAADAGAESAADAGLEPAGAATDREVAEALASLADRPLAEHAEVYEELHVRLQRTLAEIDGG